MDVKRPENIAKNEKGKDPKMNNKKQKKKRKSITVNDRR
jgi:hypothetical protein